MLLLVYYTRYKLIGGIGCFISIYLNTLGILSNSSLRSFPTTPLSLGSVQKMTYTNDTEQRMIENVKIMMRQ
jgi:hypothetical protein